MIKQYTQVTETPVTRPVNKPAVDVKAQQRVDTLENRISQLQNMVDLQTRQIRRLESQLETITESVRKGR
jgi:chaperonin cofactor prefoldin